MNLHTIIQNIDANTARAFVQAARHVIDAMLIEGERIEQTHTPRPRDYNEAELSREGPPGGWLSHAELCETARRLSEAIAAEKWTDGVLFAIRALTTVGGGA